MTGKFSPDKLQRMKEEAAALTQFGRQINAGVPIINAITQVSNQYPRLRDAFQTIHDEIYNGQSTRAGLRPHEQLFSPFVPLMLSVGETIGELQDTAVMAGELVGQVLGLIESFRDVPTDKIAEMADYRMLALTLATNFNCCFDELIEDSTSRHGQLNAWRKIETMIICEGKTFAQAMRLSGSGFPPELILAVERAGMSSRRPTDKKWLEPVPELEKIFRQEADRLQTEIFGKK